MDFKEMNPLGIIGIIGAIILVVGVFLGWIGPTSGSGTTYTGWNIWNNVDGLFKPHTEDLGLGYIKYSGVPGYFAPLVALICGIISIILMIVPTIMGGDKFGKIGDILGIVALILAIVVVICALLMYTGSVTIDTYTAGGELVSHISEKVASDGVGFKVGFWLVLVGGIITMIGGLMPILKDKGIIKL